MGWRPKRVGGTGGRTGAPGGRRAEGEGVIGRGVQQCCWSLQVKTREKFVGLEMLYLKPFIPGIFFTNKKVSDTLLKEVSKKRMNWKNAKSKKKF